MSPRPPIRYPALDRGWLTVLTVSATLTAAAVTALPAASQRPPHVVVTFDEIARIPGQAWGVAVSGERAYVAGRTLDIVDARDPADATRIGSASLPVRADRVAVAGSHAYVADGRMGLRIFDVATPSAPREVGSHRIAGEYAWDVAIAGDLALVALGEHGIRVLDVSDPAAPRHLTDNYVDASEAVGLHRRGDIVAMAGWNGGVTLFDTSDLADVPFLLTAVAIVSTTLPVRDVALDGDFAYLAVTGWDPYPAPGTDGRLDGLVVLDVTDPTWPKRVGSLAGLRDVRALSAADGLAYVADGKGGLQAIDVTDSSLPRLAGTFPAPDARDVALDGDVVYVADSEQGLLILRPRIGTPVPATATATTTATPTPGPSVTATPVRRPIFLPIAEWSIQQPPR